MFFSRFNIIEEALNQVNSRLTEAGQFFGSFNRKFFTYERIFNFFGFFPIKPQKIDINYLIKYNLT